MRRIVAAAVLWASVAHGNGRAPQSVGIYFQGNEPQTVFVSTTFGLLVSRDDGCTFDWMCEQSVGYGGTFDPTYAVGSDGTLFATTFDGLRVSRDGGCSFETATASLPASDPNRIADKSIDALAIGPTGEVWVGTAEAGVANGVFVSLDNGATFSERSPAVADVLWKSVLVAPSNPAIVYAAGYSVGGTPSVYLYRSQNGGVQWTAMAHAGVQLGQTPILRVEAIDPTSPDVIFASSEGANPPGGDRLYRSTDGGATFTEIAATAATVHDVVFRDAQHVYVATQVKTASSIKGGALYASSDGGVTFSERTDAPQLACIAKRGDGVLFGCGANWAPDFKSVARSTDGVTWEKVWRFVETHGAVTCPAGTVQRDTCDVMLWDCPSCSTDLVRQFGVTGPTCGVNATDRAPLPKPDCCDARGGPTSPIVLAIAVLWIVRRPRLTRP